MRLHLILSTLAACTGKGDSGAPGDSAAFDPGPSPYSLDDQLTLSDVQALGTHNSSHVQPDAVVHPSHAYSHAPLEVQLADQGVRQFELDIHLHDSLGFQVFHLPVIDEETTCLQLTDCLGALKAWSDANPWHLPLMVWMEPKDEDLDSATEHYISFVDRHDELEDAIVSVIPRGRILTPDGLRGDASTLPQALAEGGWPTLGELRGRFIFAMLDSGNHRAAYLAGSDVLAGRLLFVDADTDADPFAALFKINDAAGNAEEVAARVAAGFVVTSNLRDGPEHSQEEAEAHLAASLAAGAHFLSSDRPAPVDDGRGDWFSAIPGGQPARCNPLHAPSACTAAQIEDLPVY